MNTRFLEFWQKKTSLGTFNLLEFLLSNFVLDEDIPIWWSLHVGYSLRYLQCLFGGHENLWLVWEGCLFLRASPPKQKQFRTKTAMKARAMNAVWYLGPIQYKATPPGSRHEEEGSEQDCTRQVGKGNGLQRRACIVSTSSNDAAYVWYFGLIQWKVTVRGNKEKTSGGNSRSDLMKNKRNKVGK